MSDLREGQKSRYGLVADRKSGKMTAGTLSDLSWQIRAIAGAEKPMAVALASQPEFELSGPASWLDDKDRSRCPKIVCRD